MNNALQNRLLRADMEEARHRLFAGEMLPTSLWCAYIADLTQIPTFPWRIDRDKFLCVPVEGVFEYEPYLTEQGREARTARKVGERIVYYSVSHIADIESAWYPALGQRAMLEAIQLLKDESDRNIAWNYLHGIYRADQENDTAPAAVRQSIRAATPGVQPLQTMLPVLTLVSTAPSAASSVDGFMGGGET